MEVARLDKETQKNMDGVLQHVHRNLCYISENDQRMTQLKLKHDNPKKRHEESGSTEPLRQERKGIRFYQNWALT